MYIKDVYIKGFRSIQELRITCEPGVTTLVGENTAGKSTIGMALSKLFQSCGGGENLITSEDYPYGILEPITIVATLKLSPEELMELLVSPLVESTYGKNPPPNLQGWLIGHGDEIKLSLDVDRRNARSISLSWGTLLIDEGHMFVCHKDPDKTVHNVKWVDITRKLPPSDIAISHSDTISDIDRILRGYRFNVDMNYMNYPRQISDIAVNKFKLVTDFRIRSAQSGEPSIESLTGSETARALLNLKNHPDSRERSRYNEIKKTFTSLFPRIDIEAVESPPASGAAEIQFYEQGREATPLSLRQVSAGVHELLTLVTNLVARDGLMMFLEHPETHLHSHSKRALQSLLIRAAERNQIIMVTHDQHFVDPLTPQSLRRVWWVPESGTQVISSPTSPTAVEIEQMRTALRHIGTREVVFSRAVVLVEDESQQEFLRVIASILGHDIDANNISVIEVGGHDGYRPYCILLDRLGIPYVTLRDKGWGDNPSYPPKRYFSLGCELEAYLDKHNLAEIRYEIEKKVGRSKRRVAGVLGSRLTHEQIPPIFNEVLKAAMNLSTGLIPAQVEVG